MVIIGMLHYQKHPDKVKKAYPFAAVAKMEGIEFIYFSFSGIDFNRKKVNGWIYENGKWMEKETDIPVVIINSCNPKNLKQREIMKKLKSFAAFTSFSVGNKLKVYRKVKKAKKFSQFLLPSSRIRSPKDVLSLVETESSVVMKPVNGNQGKRIYFIRKAGGRYEWTDGHEVNWYCQDQVESLVSQVIAEEHYLLQPFIECKTKSGLTYDFRLHVQKNGSGEWEITLIYPRISGTKKLVSNISSGGFRGELLPFLRDEFSEAALTVRDRLEEFALSFAVHFESLYKNPFDELGIDVGLDHQQKLWIFEVNWRPGAKNREFEVAKRMIPYCRYLAKQRTGDSPPPK